MKTVSMKKTVLALCISALLSGQGMAQNTAQPANYEFQYEENSNFLYPIDLTDKFKSQNLFNLENGSITLRVSSALGFMTFLGVSNSESATQYASFYVNRANGTDTFGIELRNGGNLIHNSDLRVTLPANHTDFRTLTYTFDKDNQQITIYVDGEKVKTHSASKFFADIPGLNSAF
ncbi:hypothetical protein RO21_11865 [[Actinobacillus] muris]|uniref:Glycoside hydrolase family 33 N-terminal domain-containing protein n=1 Tax=Muribacter muris TaxID=67855 RepID=A0A0J5S0P5_9PAST|nr:sialidase domain-containing protein [Muribacter muris]KMK50432.1 hypothetical protein RO21_11865 [[Actinobacillus] muris] [Muribacter muris]